MKLKIALIMSGIVAVSGCGGSGEDSNPPPTYTIPGNQVAVDPTSGITDSSQYNDIGVHDPSIIKVDGTYYVFGSHLGAAKSDNLMNWSLVSESVETSGLFAGSYAEQAAEGIAWTDGYVGSWAADVIQAPNGKFWFYYNHCAQSEADGGCWNRSYMGLAVADAVEGPYTNQGVFLRTGYRDGELATYPVEGVDAYNPAVHPNGIDPAAFYDKDDNLWMVYGSYSGGIYILAMDETTGMPEAGQGYGTPLVGGDYNAIEGSFVMYSPESDYYYLFWSDAGFAADDGYNIRVARSKTPNGPYLDAAGNNMVDATVANEMGNKLLGSHLWVSAFGETSAQYGYNAPGHNSALYDETLGKYLLFTHTRFPQEERRYDNIEAHAIRVHEMWLNNDDWLVVSPDRYAPVEGDNVVDPADLAGDYRIVLQNKDSNGDEHTSMYVTLTNQGRYIQGELSGVYKLYSDQPERIRFTIQDDTTYEGVAKWQWNVEDARFEVVFSGLSADGQSAFATRLPTKTAADVVDDISNAINAALANPNDPEQLLVLKQDISLPTIGARDAKLTWSSSHPRYVSNEGKVTRPNSGEGDKTVTLTATVDILGQTLTVTQDVVVAQRSVYNRTAQYSFEEGLSDSLGNFAAATTSSDVAMTTSPAPVYTDGQIGKAINLDGTFGVMLPNDLIDSHQYTVAFWLNQQLPDQWFRPAFFAAQSADPARWASFLPRSWNGELMLWSNWVDDAGNVSWLDGFSGVTYPDYEWHHVAFAVKNGAFQIYYDGVQVGSGSNLRDIFTSSPEGSIITLGLNYWDAPTVAFYDELTIYDEALSAAEVKALDVDGLPANELLAIAQQALDLGNLESVISDLDLAYSGPFASALSWVSSDETVIDATSGKVTRPARGEANANVTLTATITLAGESTTKEFAVTVVSKTPPEPIARFSFEDNVEDSLGNFAAGEAVDKALDTPLISPAASELLYQPGVVGQAIQFLGDTAPSTNASPGVKLPNGLLSDYSYSVSIWLNPTEITQYTTSFFGYDSTGANWLSLVPFGPAGDTLVWVNAAYDASYESTIPAGQWSHVVFVVNEGTFYGYINGQLVSTVENFPDIFTSSGSRSQFSLATHLFPWDPNFNGLMDELVIYDDPLSIDDVQELFAQGNAQ